MLFVIAIASGAATSAAVPHTFDHIIPAESPLTASPWYISPAEVEPRLARAAANDDYTGGYSSLIDKYFAEAVARHPDFSVDDRDKAPKSQALRQARQNSDDDDEDDAFAAIPVTEGDHDGDDGSDGDDTSNAPVYDQQFHDHEYDRIREASKSQEKEIVARNPKHCKVTYKDGMECSVCKDPKSGAHSQSCTFSSTAPAKKYAYTKERNYNSRDKDDDKKDDGDNSGDDDESGDEEEGDDDDDTKRHKPKDINPPKRTKTNTKPSVHQVRHHHHGRQHSNQPKKSTKSSGKKQHRPAYLQSYASNDDDVWRPILAPYRYHSYAAEASEQHADVVAAEPFLFGVRASEALATGKQLSDVKHSKRETSQKKRNADQDEGRFSFEQFFARDFPEARSAGLIRKQSDGDGSEDDGDDGDNDDEEDSGPDAVEFLPDYAGKRNVEKVLAEFKTRDWSKCERKLRDSLTCYVCHDDRGVRHEECMFVSGNDDKQTQNAGNSHLSYTETKEYHGDGHNDKNKGGKKSSEVQKKAHGPKSEQLRQKDDDDDDDEDDSDEEVQPVKQRKHVTKKTVIVRRRQHNSPSTSSKVSDAGVHQATDAGNGKRTIKRQTAEGTADYAHLIRHDEPPTVASSSSLKTY